MLKKIQTNPFASLVWTLLLCAVHIVIFKSKISADYQVWQRLLSMLAAVCITLPIHELLHFVFVKLFYKGDVRIKIIKSPIGLPTLGTVTDGKFQKWQLVIIYLAPFVFLTLIIDAIMIFCTEVWLLFFIVPMCNSAGCFYDILEMLITVTQKEN